jgi:tRNA nucleotidyltransferase/poly(A) polymerase
MKTSISQLKTYLVGGAVRDIYMGETPKDRDYVVLGSSPEEMLSLGFEQVGADFPVFLHPETKEEYALARRERKVGAGYLGFECEFGFDVTLEEDLNRRDFTCNSMAMDLETNEIIDPFDGRHDIDRDILRITSPAFKEDPLRVLRMARFAARYDWHFSSESVVIAREVVLSGALNELPAERFWKEIEKSFDDESLREFFNNLDYLLVMESSTFFKNALPKWAVYKTMFGDLESVECISALLSNENTTIWASARAKRIAKALLMDTPRNAETMYSYLLGCDAFRMSSILRDVVTIKYMGYYAGARQIYGACNLCKTVTAADFPNLEGKELGDAIKDKRMQLIACLYSDLF